MRDSYRFECQRCGDCCQRPGYFTPDGLRKAAEHLGLEPVEFFESYCDAPPGKTVIVPRTTGLYCSFLDRDGATASCRIHESKPSRCSSSPLVIEKYLFDDATTTARFERGTARFAFIQNCPGSGKGGYLRVRDVVRETEMEADMNFQLRSLKETARKMGEEEFMRALALRNAGILPPDLAIRLRNAVLRAYGLPPDLSL